MTDFEWTDGLCADEIAAVDETPVNGGQVRRGGSARVLAAAASTDASEWRGRTVTVQEIAVGSKGKGPFRKRLWVALRVTDEQGQEGRLMATDLEVAPSP